MQTKIQGGNIWANLGGEISHPQRLQK